MEEAVAWQVSPVINPLMLHTGMVGWFVGGLLMWVYLMPKDYLVSPYSILFPWLTTRTTIISSNSSTLYIIIM